MFTKLQRYLSLAIVFFDRVTYRFFNGCSSVMIYNAVFTKILRVLMRVGAVLSLR